MTSHPENIDSDFDPDFDPYYLAQQARIELKREAQAVLPRVWALSWNFCTEQFEIQPLIEVIAWGSARFAAKKPGASVLLAVSFDAAELHWESVKLSRSETRRNPNAAWVIQPGRHRRDS